MTDVRQYPEVPEIVSNTYMALRYAFDCLCAHWNELKARGYPNCHVIARAIAGRFDCLEHRDGFIPFIAKPGEGYQGPMEMLAIEREGKMCLTPVVSNHKYHSWLVFREHGDFIIDTAPIGALPVLSSPILIFRDPWAFPYTEDELASPILEGVTEERIKEFSELLRQAVLRSRK